jgi:hypothetical protein
MMKRVLIGLVCLAAFLATRPAAAQTLFVNDTFTAAANTMLESHAPNSGGAWTRVTGANGLTINGAADNVRNVSTVDWNVYANATVSPGAEVVVGATVTFAATSANNFVDLFGRGSASLLVAYSGRVTGAATNNVTITRWNGGVPTVLATSTLAVTAGVATSVVFSIKNALKTVEINGVVVLSSADNSIVGVGQVGLGMQSNAANGTIVDNYFASTFAVTAVDHLEATATRDGSRTLLQWSTAREVRNLGFRVFRDDGHGPVAASRALIAGAAFMLAGGSLPAGNSYRWIDSDPRAKTAKAWWIEDVDLRGHGVWHGPIIARNGAIDARLAVSTTFADSRQRDAVAPAASVQLRTLSAKSVTNSAAAGDRRRAIVPMAGEMATQRTIAARGAIRIAVSADGLYRVTRSELAVAGLDANADVQSLRLYADGTEVPIEVTGSDVRFYGRALDTPSTATRIYWLVSGDGAGMRIPTAAAGGGAVTMKRSFAVTAERTDKVYFVTFLRESAPDHFVGPLVSTDPAQATIQTLQLRHVDSLSKTAMVTVVLQGSSEVDTPEDHRVAVTFNGQHVGDLTFDAFARASSTFNVPGELVTEGANNIGLAAMNGDLDASAVVSVAVTYDHTFVADDGLLLAAVAGNAQTSISGFSTNDVEILDVTDERLPIRIVPAVVDGTATFVAPGLGERTILAVDSSRTLQAASITRDHPSSLHDSGGADVVIVSDPAFIDSLAPLVQLRQSQGLSVLVATTDDIYDEFNFGAKDPQAIRSFLTNARRRATPPRYVLLVGDASFDERNYLGVGNFDFVPTQLVKSDLLDTASDSWFTDFDDDGAPDVPIGRFSARSPADVAAEVAKVVAYETSALPPSRTVMLVSDADPAIDFHANTVALEASIPAGFEVVDVNAAASGAAAARQELLSRFNEALLVNYMGHGSVEIWSNISFFGRIDVERLTMGQRTPIVVAMTCLNGYFHDVYTDSLAETLQRAPNGAVAVWASSALTSPEVQLPANEILLQALLAPGEVRLGDAVVAAQKSSFTPDIRRTFILFGDPAMRVRSQ